MTKILYVISDLHIGGDYADATAPAGRGFRLCTNVERLTEFVQSLSRAGNRDSADIELVINGDFVDFLAEKQEVCDPITGKKGIGWMPLIEDPSDAVRTLQRIIARDEPFFIALRDFLAVGSRLTILLGNHDIELSFPAVRHYLSKVLAVDKRRFSFIFDGEKLPTSLIPKSDQPALRSLSLLFSLHANAR